jgi:hypothetical protein
MSARAIQVGTRAVGEITLDADRVRGEGGPHNPRLVLPVTIRMHTRPAAETLTLTELVCTLYAGSIGPAGQIGQPAIVDLTRGLPARSNPHGSTPSYHEIQFPLSDALISLLEEHRHRTENKAFAGWLTISATVAWLAALGGESPLSQNIRAIPDFPFGTDMGICFTLAWFQDTIVENLSVPVSASVWIDSVLPGLGLDHLRLVEIALPHAGGALPDSVIPLFDAARRDYDEGRYRESIQKCRDVRTRVEKHLGATKHHPVGDAIGDRVASPLNDDEREFLNQSWTALVDFTSAAHHQPAYVAADAKVCLLLTAVLLEFLQGLLAAPPLGHGSRGAGQ